MLNRNSAAQLSQTVDSLQVMTRFALAVLALASGVYTYLGVRSLLDGSATFVFFAAIIYSAAVSVGIYAFWSYMLRFVPLIRDMGRRVALFGVMLIGSLMIIAMSSWLNAAALAGSAALEQHLAVTLEGYAADLDDAHANALAAQSLLPDVRRASERFARLAQNERDNGALTGTSGAGSVVQLLTQMSAQLNELSDSIVDSRDRVAELFATGSAHLAAMRELVSAPGQVQIRADAFAAEVVALTGVVAALQETSVAPSVKRASQDLSLGFIAPIADGGTQDLVVRQDRVMATVRDSVAAQSAALSQAADEILAEPRVEQRRFVPLSTAEAVLRYWSDFVPSWAGAISIDLLPFVMVLVLVVVQGAIRKESDSLEHADTVTAAEMFRAVALYREMTGEVVPARPGAVQPVVPAPQEGVDANEEEPGTSEVETVGEASADGTVTTLDLHQRKRTETPKTT
jgi:hypothetical protein